MLTTPTVITAKTAAHSHSQHQRRQQQHQLRSATQTSALSASSSSSLSSSTSTATLSGSLCQLFMTLAEWNHGITTGIFPTNNNKHTILHWQRPTFGQRDIDHNFTNHIYIGKRGGVEVQIEGGENYLYLNVYRVKPDKPRPVMVWIYGGGFCSGEAARERYASDYFMRKDVIVVTVQHRLGA
ncbi:putative inactive carboxylesterase 4 [Bactrocera dorsalis]|uniref:carboxylesterase n=1 Tax=Bactrocera dorsalis TaxID=27457 RepID=A0ABM3JWL8_BACDO|nr:putative inactive carboxylesterase 4 [Bactrocera dorsalis]